MAEQGFVTLRFAYRGAGPSTETMGKFWRTGYAPDDPKRVDDARAALEHLKSAGPEPLHFIGYSFGASVVSALLFSAWRPGRIVLIGPTLCQHSFEHVQKSSIRKLIITGDNDFATPLEDTRTWFENAQSPKKLVIIEAGEHFYRGLEDRLVAEIGQWL
jgi:alpha/beta superfamily hydrolase